jgi:hypothetical protein
MKNGRLEPCYYGRREVVYVTIVSVDRTRSKNLSVYGHSHKQVVRAIDDGLTRSFGKTGCARPKGRPRKSRRT